MPLLGVVEALLRLSWPPHRQPQCLGELHLVAVPRPVVVYSLVATVHLKTLRRYLVGILPVLR